MKKSGIFAAVCAAACVALAAAMPTRGVGAHRGNDGRMPENTVPAFANAVKLGAQMVEMDVKRCRTGELLILHDRTVDRTTNGKGELAQLSFDEARALKANVRGGKPIPGFDDVKIPTFEEALDAIPADAPVWINCHCAANAAAEAARVIQRKGRLHQAFVATTLKGIREARKAVPNILTCNMSRPFTGAAAYHRPWPPEMSARYAQETIANKCEFLQLLAPCSKTDVEMLHKAGVKIGYFKVDSMAKVKPLLDLGVDFILTDNLEVIRDTFKSLTAPAAPSTRDTSPSTTSR